MHLSWGALSELKKKGFSFNETLFFAFSLNDVQSFVITLNTGSPFSSEGQLFQHGIDSEGVSLGDYAPFTIEEKKKKGLPFDRITLYDEGDFYASFEVKQTKDGFYIVAESIVDSGEDLTEQFGNEILGLTDESIEKLGEKVIPYITEHLIRKILS